MKEFVKKIEELADFHEDKKEEKAKQHYLSRRLFLLRLFCEKLEQAAVVFSNGPIVRFPNVVREFHELHIGHMVRKVSQHRIVSFFTANDSSDLNKIVTNNIFLVH